MGGREERGGASERSRTRPRLQLTSSLRGALWTALLRSTWSEYRHPAKTALGPSCARGRPVRGELIAEYGRASGNSKSVTSSSCQDADFALAASVAACHCIPSRCAAALGLARLR